MDDDVCLMMMIERGIEKMNGGPSFESRVTDANVLPSVRFYCLSEIPPVVFRFGKKLKPL